MGIVVVYAAPIGIEGTGALCGIAGNYHIGQLR
jgi:hypothetical protein